MTDADLRSKLAECETVIQQLVAKLQETVDENDKLRALVTNLTEGASAHDTLSELHRNRNLPAAIRAKAAIGCLGVESAPLKSVDQLELKAEEPVIPLADKIAQARAHCERMDREARSIKVLPNGQVLLLDEPDGNGSDSND
jgi:uncharacterized protein YigA (DUF484 family)